MYYKQDWKNTQIKFSNWWMNNNSGTPLMKIIAKRENVLEPLEQEVAFQSPEQAYLNVNEISKRYHNFCKSFHFYAEAFPNLDLNIGAGSLALYLGTEPNFKWDTIWFQEWVENFEDIPSFGYNQKNYWYQLHLSLLQQAKILSQDKYLVNIPDIVENIDILASMRGPQNMCYDLFDYPEEISKRITQIDNLYFRYYDSFYDIIKAEDNSSSFTAFGIWGSDKTAKVQCDFCALMNPTQFKKYIQPSIAKQCAQLDHAMYHLDGPDAIKHLDALLEIKELDVIQWTNGAGNPDGLDTKWFEPIYDKVTKAGKSLLLFVEEGDVNEWITKLDRLVDRYSTKGLYLHFPFMSEPDAQKLMETADKRWNIK